MTMATMTCMSAPPMAPTKPLYEEPSLPVAATGKRNPYRVVKELGSGLQGRVLLAVDDRVNQHVAVKLPSVFACAPHETPNYSMLNYQVQSILQERHAQRFVTHENVIKCLNLVPGKKHGHSYVAMITEYASNGDLFDMLSEGGAFPQPVAMHFFHQLMRGVQACHDSGVIHRDIKPENILFDEDFTLKICDFGLAVTTQGKGSAEEVMLRDVSGTQLYMAPEINARTTFRGTPVDVWSCGVVLFIMLTGFPPFQEAEAGDYWYDCIMSGRMDLFWESQPKNMVKPCATAMDLIDRMLCPKPALRITVPQILAHPWLQHVNRINVDRVVQEMEARQEYMNSPSSCEL